MKYNIEIFILRYIYSVKTIDSNNPSAIRSISINRDASMIAAVTSNVNVFYKHSIKLYLNARFGSFSVYKQGDCQIWSMTGFVAQTQLIKRKNFLAHKRYALKCLFSPDMTYVLSK